MIFLFQMVFMDDDDHRHRHAVRALKYAAFWCRRFPRRVHVSDLRELGVGRRVLAMLGANFGLGWPFAGSGVVHSVGGITALACALILGPRIGKFKKDGTPNPIPGHDIMWVLCGCFILAFGWFGFNPGSTLAMSGNGGLRAASVAVNTMLAGMTGSFGGILYMWIRYGKPDASMSGNAFLAGLVAITAPSGFVPDRLAVIGLIAGVLSANLVRVRRARASGSIRSARSRSRHERHLGRHRHGPVRGRQSNYGGSWNGVNGNVTGPSTATRGSSCAAPGVATLLASPCPELPVQPASTAPGARLGGKSELAGLDMLR